MKSTVCNDNCYSGYSWRVYKHNRFVGYVVANSETHALRQANEKFGSHVLVERIMLVSPNPKDSDSVDVVSPKG